MGRYVTLAVSVCLVAVAGRSALAAVPWATTVVAYDYDGDGDSGNDDAVYSNPQAALGSPSLMAGAGTAYASVVSMFNGPWTGGEVVSIAPGGYLVLGFDRPIVNDPSHLYGVDLIIFGNATFTDAAWPNGQLGSPAGLWGEPGTIEVSVDGVDWRVVPGVSADTLFPTQAFQDAGAYDTAAGSVVSDFLRPVNPALQLSDFDGLNYAEALALYDGSGGGTPVDIGAAGLSEANYVRISLAAENRYTVEIDAMAVVPEPASVVLLVVGVAALVRRRVA